MTALLLDTCAVIWTGSDSDLSEVAVNALDESYDKDRPVYVSPFTAWELGILVARDRLRLPKTAGEWFNSYMFESGTTLAELSPDILVASSFLPGTPPNDPADRIIITTAREYDLTIVTRDKRILDYANAGHVKAMEC
jgi:PIN domain nuclease of toxin-antitoxin system